MAGPDRAAHRLAGPLAHGRVGGSAGRPEQHVVVQVGGQVPLELAERVADAAAPWASGPVAASSA